MIFLSENHKKNKKGFKSRNKFDFFKICFNKILFIEISKIINVQLLNVLVIRKITKYGFDNCLSFSLFGWSLFSTLTSTFNKISNEIFSNKLG